MDTTEETVGPRFGVPVIELLTRSGCHLCEDARTVVVDVAAALGLPWQEVSIDDDVALTERFGEEIPVVLVNGVPRDFWHIDAERLQGVLRRAIAESQR